MDAVVLRGRVGGRRHPAAESSVKKRPDLLTGEDLPEQPQQKRSREKRRRLKSAGLAVFGEKGYERASIQEMAERAKLPVGGFYQHFRSKRQLLLTLMDELLEHLSLLDLQPGLFVNAREALHAILSRAFSRDLEYLGAYRAWQEATLADPDLAKKQAQIQAWTTLRVRGVFERLQRLQGARRDVDVEGLARAMDSFFWGLLAQAVQMPRPELNRWIDVSTHLIYHALFKDPA